VEKVKNVHFFLLWKLRFGNSIEKKESDAFALSLTPALSSTQAHPAREKDRDIALVSSTVVEVKREKKKKSNEKKERREGAHLERASVVLDSLSPGLPSPLALFTCPLRSKPRLDRFSSLARVKEILLTGDGRTRRGR
jgi:hypothetical protein